MPVKPSPAPSATLVLLRDRPVSGVDVMLIQRHRASKFAAGDYVFPGGKVEADDNPPDAARWCAGLDVAAAAGVLGLTHDPERALGFWIGAIREAFEEVGVLLAYDADGRIAQVDAERAREYRHACQRDNRGFWTMLAAEGLTLATDRLVYFAHWITPEEQPLRFDTRFFATQMPSRQTAAADDREIIAVQWFTPAEAFAARARGDISLRTPTIRNLALFDGASSAAEVLGSLAGRPVAMIRPRLILDGRGVAQGVLLPGDPGYF